MGTLSVPCDPIDAERLKERIENRCRTNSNGCWIWQGRLHIGDTGTGDIHIMDHTFRIDHVAYCLYTGVIPRYYRVKHLCGEVTCCNAAHMTLVPIETKVQFLRMNALSSKEIENIATSTIGITKLMKEHDFTRDHILRVRKKYQKIMKSKK